MSYGYKIRIGYHEVDSQRKLTLSSIINHFQDCGSFHGDECGYSNQALAKDDLAWILSSWQIVIKRRPNLSEWAMLTTSPYKYKHFLANRYFLIESLDKEECVRADSVWVLMNMKEQKPVRISDEMAKAYAQASNEDPDIFKGYDFGGRKIIKTGDFSELAKIDVAPYMIDTNKHVNNAEYIAIAQSYLPEGFTWNAFRGEYTGQARLGDVMFACLSVLEEKCQIALNNEKGEQFFLGEWSTRSI